MKTLLAGIVLAIASTGFTAQEPNEEEARLLLEDVRGWNEADAPPTADDIRWLCDLATSRIQAKPTGAAHTLLVELVRACGSLAHRLDRQGRNEEAVALTRWSGERALELGDEWMRSWSFEWLGQDAWVRGELELAAELTRQAADIDEKRGAPEDLTRHLADIARIRMIQGRFDEALEAITAARGASHEAGSEEAERLAAEIHGSLLLELGRHREALALCVAFEPNDPRELTHDESRVRLDILAADVLADVGRLESASTYARRAHEIALDPDVQRLAPLLHLEAKLTLGLLLGDQGRCDEAVDLLDQASAEFARLEDQRGVAWAAKNRGFARFAAGRYVASLPDFEEAWRAGRELGVPFLEGIGALGVAEALVFAGRGPSRRGPNRHSPEDEPLNESRVNEALAVAARVADELREPTLEWRGAALRGRMHLDREEYAEALQELRRAVLWIERWRRRLRTTGLVEHALRQRSDPYRDAAFAAAHLGRMEEALAYAGLLQARVLDQLCARDEGPLPDVGSPALESLRENIKRLEAELERTQSDRPKLQARLNQAEDELDTALLRNELASGRALAGVSQPLPVEDLGMALAREGFDIALTYLVGPGETLCLRIEAGPKARISGRLLSIGAAELEACVERLRRPIARLEAGELDLAHLGFDVRAARELWEALVRPMALEPEARIAWVGDGSLGALPLELLITGGELGLYDPSNPFDHLRGLRFLGDEHAIVSFGSLARLTRTLPARQGKAVVFVAPDAQGLPGAIEEGRLIAQALGAVEWIPDARPEDVVRLAPGAALLHFAAHGRLDPERPARGHLLLGGDEARGARLESWQVAELDLEGARVVLSACHSGRGESLAGAGLAGLSRGFFLAGAREVVASQWAVDDRVTARFMELFYGELATGTETAEALRRTRFALRLETDPRGFALAHPAFWAAWSLRR